MIGAFLWFGVIALTAVGGTLVIAKFLEKQEK